MLDLVKKVLASHKCQMDRSREQYTRDLAGMPLGHADAPALLTTASAFSFCIRKWDLC